MSVTVSSVYGWLCQTWCVVSRRWCQTWCVVCKVGGGVRRSVQYLKSGVVSDVVCSV